MNMFNIHLSHPCILEACDLFDFTGLQLEGEFSQDESYFESFTHVWFRQNLDETLDLDFKVDAEMS